jgi:hypothetical protein
LTVAPCHAESDQSGGKPGVAVASPNADPIVLDALGKLLAHGHGLSGCCRRRRHYFDVPMPALIAVRGADSPVDMRPVTCAGWDDRETEIRVKAPCEGAGFMILRGGHVRARSDHLVVDDDQGLSLSATRVLTAA